MLWTRNKVECGGTWKTVEGDTPTKAMEERKYVRMNGLGCIYTASKHQFSLFIFICCGVVIMLRFFFSSLLDVIIIRAKHH